MARARRSTPWGPSRYETLGNSTVSFMSIHPQVLSEVDPAGPELGRLALDDDAAAVEDDDVVGDVEHQLGVLLDQHDREPLGLETADRRHDLGDDLGRQAFGRLVHQEHPRVRHQRAADREHLLLAAGERRGDLLMPLPQPREQARHSIERPQQWQASARLPGSHAQILSNRQAAKHAAPLRHERHALRGDELGGASGDRAAVDRDLAVARREQADGDVHRGGLAGPVAAEQAEQPARAQAQGHAVQHVAIAVEGVDLAQHERVIRQGAQYTASGGRIGPVLSEEQNRALTEVGAGTPMGELLRRYWMPIAAVAELDDRPTKPVRLLGEDLVLYKDKAGSYGLVDQHCPHRRAGSAYGFVEECGLRCHYHGWLWDHTGRCLQQPFEETAHPDARFKDRVRIKAYAVEAKAGLLWAYLGPPPAPLVPTWEPFTWQNGFVQIVFSEVPCNWFQCQENSIDPVHFEWLHSNWSRALSRADGDRSPTHLKIGFEEFEYGFTYRRILEGQSEQDELCNAGRCCLWPDCMFTS